MSLTVVEEPADRPAWLRETILLLTERSDRGRAALLELVAGADDATIGLGTDDAWGLGQIAVHLLLVERGVAGIALRLAQGDATGSTGQPRPGAGSATREGIRVLAQKAAAATERLRAGFPAEPDTVTTARHPFYGQLNCFGWLLTLPNHYGAHIEAHLTGRTSAL